MSKKQFIVAVVAVLVVMGVGVVTIGYALKDTPLGRTALNAVGIQPPPYVQRDVDNALLTLADLPGYAEAPTSAPNDKPAELQPCGSTVETLPGTGTPSRRELTLSKSSLGPYLSHTTVLLANGTTLEPLRTAFHQCSSWTQPNGDKYTIADANYGAFGNETLSLKLAITQSEGGLSFGMAITMIRKQNLLSAVTLAGFPDVSGDEMVAVVQKAGAKLPA